MSARQDRKERKRGGKKDKKEKKVHLARVASPEQGLRVSHGTISKNSKKLKKEMKDRKKEKLIDDWTSRVAAQAVGSAVNTSTNIIRSIIPNAQVAKYLLRVPLLAHLTKFEREKLGGALQEECFLKEKAVFNRGAAGDGFYVIKEGTATVVHEGQTLCQLTPGDYFGEQALLTNSLRSATVIADEFLVCYVLPKAAFHALFKKDRIDVVFAKRGAVSAETQRDRETEEDGPEVKTRTARDLLGTLPSFELTALEREPLLKAIRESLLFRHIDDEDKNIFANVMHTIHVNSGEDLIVEGDEGHCFYVVQEGEFEVLQIDQDTKENAKVDHHGPGGSFGEMALMYNAPRNATCRALTPCVVRCLERMMFNRIVQIIGTRKTEQYSQWLANVELLAPLSNVERSKLAEALEVEDYAPNQVVFQQGEASLAMFVIVKGEVVVTKNTDDVDRELGRCRSGEFFGERALMDRPAPRTGTVTAAVATRLLRLDRTAFELLLGPLEDVLRRRLDGTSETGQPKKTKRWRPLEVSIGDLEVVGVLGKGSYGFVQLVKHVKTGKTFALKAVSKQRIVETKQKAHVMDEKNLMTQLNHPFMVKLLATFKSKNLLFFLLEPVLGGELFTVLRRLRMFNVGQAKFYAAQVVLMFQYLHDKMYAYRDLKPENLLLDKQGYLKLTDFGFLKRVKHKTWTMCGTPEYLAPEVISSNGYQISVDWWTLGIFIFEMLASYTPFYGAGGHLQMYNRISRGKFKYPSHFPKDVKNLIKGLLQVQPSKRLGVVQGGAVSVMIHKWFKGFDWQALLWRKLQAPFRVAVKDDFDLSNYDPKVQALKVKAYKDDGTDWDADF